MTPELLAEIRDLTERGLPNTCIPTGDMRDLLDEIDRFHSWDGLMSLLNEHWPDWLFVTAPDPEDYHDPLYRQVRMGEYVRANPGVIITGLIRWVDKLRKDQP